MSNFCQQAAKDLQMVSKTSGEEAPDPVSKHCSSVVSMGHLICVGCRLRFVKPSMSTWNHQLNMDSNDRGTFDSRSPATLDVSFGIDRPSIASES